MKSKLLLASCYPEMLAFLLLFLGDITAALLAIIFLVFADTVTGVWASIKNNQYLTSRRAGRILSKLLLYPLSIIVAKVAESYLTPSIPWIQVVSGIIAIVEVKSIFENISLILGFDLWPRIKEALWKERDKPKKDEK
jgi:phage-related holin